MNTVKIGEISIINREETMEHINKAWAKAKAHPKIAIGIAVVVVIIIVAVQGIYVKWLT